MSKPRSVIVDGTDLSSIGDVTHFEVFGRFGGHDADWPSERLPSRGEVVVANAPQEGGRVLRLTFTAEASTRAALQTLLDEVRWRLGPRQLRALRFVDDETRESFGYVIDLAFPPIRPHLSQPASGIEVRVWCPDPREYATSDTVVSAIGASDKDLPLGAKRSLASIVVTGAAAFILTYKSDAPATIHTLEIAGATSPVTIDMSLGLITDFNGNAMDHLVEPSAFPFAFDPDDGDFPAASWPTLATSAGTAVATYRKAY